MAIGRTNCGVGGGLNFKVVGGTTQPASPKENTIWVNTNKSISNWAFQSEQPMESENILWVRTTEASNTAYDAIHSNVLMVYPIAAKLYSSGEWNSVEAFIYQNGEWKSLSPVPPEYQMVEYLESSGTQYIDTGVVPAMPIQFDISYALTTANHSNRSLYPFGSANFSVINSDANVVKFRVFDSANKSLPHGDIPTSTDNVNISINAESKTNITVKFGDLTQSYTIANYTTSINSICIFAVNGSSSVQQHEKMRLYSCSIEMGGEKVREFYPCYRKSDSVAGLWDSVSKNFFTNKGSGTFVVGGDL